MGPIVNCIEEKKCLHVSPSLDFRDHSPQIVGEARRIRTVACRRRKRRRRVILTPFHEKKNTDKKTKVYIVHYSTQFNYS